jgi:hypothetical protein
VNRPENGRILLPGLQNRIVSVQWLDQRDALNAETTPHGPIVTLSDSSSTVVKLVVEGDPEVIETPVLPDEDGVIRLTPIDAQLQGELKPGQYAGVDRVGGWQKTDDVASWKLEAPSDGNYRAVMKATTPEGQGQLKVVAPSLEVDIAVNPTKRWRRDYLEYALGTISLESGNTIEVQISTEIDNDKMVYVNVIELHPLA